MAVLEKQKRKHFIAKLVKYVARNEFKYLTRIKLIKLSGWSGRCGNRRGSLPLYINLIYI